jgi:outer membrane lipoprotein-sorting protein
VGGAVLALTLAAGAFGISAVRAEPTPDLPPIAADELLASTLHAMSSPPPLAGTVRTHVDLGIPALPDISTGAASGDTATAASMLLGDQTFRLWRSPDGIRISHLARFQEQVLVANHAEAWAWDSQSLRAVRLTPQDLAAAVPRALARRVERSAPSVPPSLGDPIRIARTMLEGVSPYAVASVATPERVAGRDAYTLRLSPRSERTLVGAVDVAIDAETRLPLRLQVVPRNTLDPSIEVGFSAIEYGSVDRSIFTFDPPAEASVTDAAPAVARVLSAAHVRRLAAIHGDPAKADINACRAMLRQARRTPFPTMRAFGEGFGLILAVRVTEVPRALRSMLPYSGPLASATLADGKHGAWIVAGAVTPDALSSVLSRLP